MRHWNPDFWLRLPRHAQVVAATCGGCLVLGVLLVASILWGWYGENTRHLEELEPRIARLQGYTQSLSELRRASSKAREQLAVLTYPANSDSASTGANVQQQLRKQFEAVGLSITGSQVLAPEVQQGFEVIRVDIAASGSMESLDQALLALRAMQPLMLINTLELTPTRTRRGDDSQNIILQLSVSTVKLL